MRKRILIAFVLLIGAVLSGCLGTDADPENGEDSSPPGDQETTPKYLPPRVDGVELPNVTYPNYQFRDCQTLSVGIRVPIESVEKVVPKEFQVRSIAAPLITEVSLRISQCADSIDNSSIHGSGFSYMAIVPIIPLNESWATSGTPEFYVLDPAFDNGGLQDSLEQVHFPAESADFSVDDKSLAGDVFVTEFEISTSSWGIRLTYRHVPNEPQSLGHETYLWYGEGPFHRFHESTTYVSTAFSTATANPITLEGDSSVSSLIPAPVYPYRSGSWRADMNTIYQYDGAWGVI